VPDATNLFDYNRYMYVRGRVLNMNDPSGHCSTSQPSTSDAEAYREWSSCWTNVNTILQQWDTTPDYFNGRYGSKEWFGDGIANRTDLGADFFSGEIMRWVQSDEFAAWEAQHPTAPISQNVLDDPHCAGGQLCQGLLNHVAQVEQKCREIDCVAVGNDLVGVAGTVTVAIACIPAIAACGGTAAFIGGVAATGSTGLGLWMTGTAWHEGKATNTDLAINLLTTAGGLVAPDMKDAQVTFSLVQLMWDMIPKTED
jgi:hypothetical protein